MVSPYICCTRWVTLSLHTFPYGDDLSSLSSYMNGAGITKTGSPPAGRTNEMDPSASCRAVNPTMSSVKVYDTGPLGARRKTIFSFNAVGVTS